MFVIFSFTFFLKKIILIEHSENKNKNLAKNTKLLQVFLAYANMILVA